jgi:hypothetical protein
MCIFETCLLNLRWNFWRKENPIVKIDLSHEKENIIEYDGCSHYFNEFHVWVGLQTMCLSDLPYWPLPRLGDPHPCKDRHELP